MNLRLSSRIVLVFMLLSAALLTVVGLVSYFNPSVQSLALVSILALLAFTAPAVFLARTITRPLRALAETVRNFSREAGARPEPASSGDEVSLLAHEFELMGARVSARTAALSAESAERQAAQEGLLLRNSALLAAVNPIVIVDRRGLIQWVNPAFTKLTGYTDEEAIGQNPRVLKSGRHDQKFYKAMWQTILSGAIWQGEIINRRKDGSLYPEEMTITPVRDATDAITHFIVIKLDITARKEAEAAVEKLHRELLGVSRQAGMAEVATTVLHNVGNVLNSVNVSATLAAESIRNSGAEDVVRVAELLQEHAGDLPGFFARDPRGAEIPGFLAGLGAQFQAKQKMILREFGSLTANVEHIKEIVAMQQSYARVAGVTEVLPPAQLVEDALRLNAGALERHGVTVVREFEDVPPIAVDKHKVIQILVNLIRNAKYALDDAPQADKQLRLRICRNGGDRVRIEVRDNGVGIPAENLRRIFEHGFTTRRDG
ncbi:MAG: PAS domain S-box protein, partial [Chthoniobacteraceae bacterium]